ncbi:ac1, partial [Metarhizium majus ARSEF 297]
MAVDLEMASVSGDGSENGSDSGYETGELPGQLQTEEKYEMKGKVFFVTWSQSQVTDKHKFHEWLLASLKPRLPATGVGGVQATVELFGCKELHEDGMPHFHVLLRFEPGVHWRDGRKNLEVMVEVDGKMVVDTRSIFIRKKRRRETLAKFMDDVQAYIAKDGDVFGTMLQWRVARNLEREQVYQDLIDAPDRETTEEIYKTRCPYWWTMHNQNCQAFLNTKPAVAARPYKPKFDRRPFRVHKAMQKWYKNNVLQKPRGRPQCLVVIGYPKLGKTQWALSFGNPAYMLGEFVLEELEKSGITHCVLDDIKWNSFPYKRAMAGCQEQFVATAKWKRHRSVEYGLPTIILSNDDNSPLANRMLGKYLRQSDAVIVKLRRDDVLFVEEKKKRGVE